MDSAKKARLEAAGWSVGDAEDMLGLTVPERKFVDLRAKLAAAVRRLRRAKGLSQKEAAREFGTSQARMVDVEYAVATLDLMFRAYFALGGEMAQLDELGVPLSAEERADVTRPRGQTKKRAKKPSTPARPVRRKALVEVEH